MKEAKHYTSLSNLRVCCELCPNMCIIAAGDRGLCRGKKNIDGVLYSDNYGKAVSICIDPIEKKPLYHFYPGSNILSLGCNTCNFACDFCQNYTISQLEARTIDIKPQNLVDLCIKHNVKAVAFTYSEPLTWFEYIYDSALLLHENNLDVVLVTNGYINERPLEELLPYIAAMNIDLKAMSETFYEKIAGGKLSSVLNTIRRVEKSCHLEITNLVIPGENDDSDSINKLIGFIAELNSDIPLHFSRYYPTNRRGTPPTLPKTLTLAKQEAEKYLKYVYLGNVPSYKESNTYCPKCRSLLIERNGFSTTLHSMNGSRCGACNERIYGRFSDSRQ